jgi:hypothetical protein
MIRYYEYWSSVYATFFLQNTEYKQSSSYFNVCFCWQLAGSSTARLPVILINPCWGKTLPTTFSPYVATFRKATPMLNNDFPVLHITTKLQTFIFMETQISLLMDYVCMHVCMNEHYQASSCAQVFLTITVNTVNGCRPLALGTVVLWARVQVWLLV